MSRNRANTSAGSFRGVLGYAVDTFLKERKTYGTALLSLLVAAGAGALAAIPVKWIFDGLFSQEAAASMSVIGWASISLGLISILIFFCIWVAVKGLSSWIEVTTQRIRRALVGRIKFEPEKEIEHVREEATHVLAHVHNFYKGIAAGAVPLMGFGLVLSIMSAVMLSLNWKLGLLAIAILPLYGLPTRGMIRRVRLAFPEKHRTDGRTVDMLYILSRGAAHVVLVAGIATLLWLGAGNALAGTMTAGDLALFLAYLLIARYPVTAIFRAMEEIGNAWVSARSLNKVMSALGVRPGRADGPRKAGLTGRITFDAVEASGRYGAVNGVSLTLRPEKRLAMIGGDMHGQLTLARILVGLDDFDEGKVELDGAEIGSYDIDHLRSHIDGSAEEGILLSATIRDFVAAGEPAADDDAILEVFDKLGLGDWLAGLPLCLDTQTHAPEGRLSNGERRMLEMARTAYLNSPVLIVEDPTSGVDDDERRLITVALDRVSKGRTTILITNELRIAARFDRIAYFHEGEIIETGTHSELSNSDGPYAQRFKGTSPGPVLYTSANKEPEPEPVVLGEPEEMNPFVFVVGCPGSGVSLVQQLLDRHDMLSVTNDTHFIPTVLTSSGARGDTKLTDELVDRVRSFQNFDRLGLENIEVYKAGAAAKTYSDFVTNLYNLYAAKAGKELVGVKVASYCRNIKLLHELFPWARYIHVVRDGRDVAMSVLERATTLAQEEGLTPSRELAPTGTTALWWNSMVSAARRDGRRLGDRHYREIRFEDLVDQPDRTLGEITSFLGLSNSAKISRINASPSLEVGVNGLQDWRTQMPRNDVALFEALAGETLQDLGYVRGVRNIPDEVLRAADLCRIEWKAQQQTGRGSPFTALVSAG